MSSESLPLKVDPFRLADHAASLQGQLSTKNMERLAQSLIEGTESTVNILLNFSVDEEGRRLLRGHIEATLMLQCQRCLEPYPQEILDDFLLGIVQTEEELKKLSKDIDPLSVEGNNLYIQDIIEDELIVSLPIVPMHLSSECKVTLPISMGSEEKQEEKDNPFKVIEMLRKPRETK